MLSYAISPFSGPTIYSPHTCLVFRTPLSWWKFLIWRKIPWRCLAQQTEQMNEPARSSKKVFPSSHPKSQKPSLVAKKGSPESKSSGVPSTVTHTRPHFLEYWRLPPLYQSFSYLIEPQKQAVHLLDILKPTSFLPSFLPHHLPRQASSH